MHRELAKGLIERVRKRVAEGDCPTEPPLSVELLEDLVLTLADQDRTDHPPNQPQGRRDTMTKAKLQFDNGYTGKYLGEALTATRGRLERELEAASGIIKRDTVDAEGVTYFRENIASLKAAIAELRVVEVEAMRAGAIAFRPTPPTKGTTP